MNSVVNGDVHDECVLKKSGDGLKSDVPCESISSPKISSSDSDANSILKTDPSPGSFENDLKKCEKEDAQYAEDHTPDTEEKTPIEKEAKSLIENGTVCSSSNGKEKGSRSPHNEMEDSVNNVESSSFDEKENVDLIELENDISGTKTKQSICSSVKTDISDNKACEIKEIDFSGDLNDTTGKNTDNSISSASKTDMTSDDEAISIPSESNSAAKTDSQSCDVQEMKASKDLKESLSQNLGNGDVAEDLVMDCDSKTVKSDTIDENLSIKNPFKSSEIKSLNLISDESLDLSGSKSKKSNSQIKENGKSSPEESNPLEKLNEHLKSIGSEGAPKGLPNINQKDNSLISAALKSELQTCNKENKVTHDRFKESPDNFVFAELSNEETGFPEVFTGLVKIGRYISVKGDFTLRSTEALVESPSLVSSYLLKEPDVFPPKEKDSKSEQKDFFHSAAGGVLIGIGLSHVNEWYHKDMVRIKKRQMKREGKRPQLEEELAAHENNYSEAKRANNVYSYSYKVCKTCGFTTESSVVMEGHLLVPHITQRREYQCNFCDVIDRDPKVMLEHMEKEHEKVGRIQPPVLFFECPSCTFESNSKVKLNNHLAKCQRYFDLGVNQAPPRDFEFPALTPKPITVAVVKAYEKSLGSMQKVRGRPKKQDTLADSMHANQYSSPTGQPFITPNNLTPYRPNSNSPLADSLSIQNQIMSPAQMTNMNIRPAHSNSLSQVRPSAALNLQSPNRFYQLVNSAGQVVPIMGNNQIGTSSSPFPFSSNITNNSGKKMHSGSPFLNASAFGNTVRQQNSSKYSPDMTVTALPKLTGPYPVPMAKPSNQAGNLSMTSNSLVVCEICDGYIKDLDQLRTHMQLIHKVKIHPKMLVSRPPLNCQKCQWRFFTDQGLERHLLGAHGLVTSNMQELANKNKDAGCCTICGRVYASKLVTHMNQVHKVTLKPAHLSYKCTVCSATFNLYRLFENHVYLVHSGAAKRSAEGGRSTSPSKRFKSSSDKGNSSLDTEQTNHREKKDNDEVKICVECGDDVLSKKPDCKKCEKCLKSDELIHGALSTKTSKDELRKRERITEKTA